VIYISNPFLGYWHKNWWSALGKTPRILIS
jgi:hypothetical protein